MKKLLVIIAVSIVLLTVVAVHGSKKDNLAIDTYIRSIQAMDQANSYAFTMHVNQILNVPISEYKESISMNMTMEGKSVENPFSIEMAIRVDMGEELVPELEAFNSSTMKYYVKNQKIYMQNPMVGDVWIVESLDKLGDIGFELDPTYIASNFSKAVDLATIEEDEKFYVLTVETTEEDEIKESFSEIINNIVKNIGTGLHGGSKDVDKKTTINHLSLKIWIDKETYCQNRVEMNVSMEITDIDYTQEIEQNVVVNFNQFGEFLTIEVPDDVIENAVSLDTFLKNSIPVYSQ